MRKCSLVGVHPRRREAEEAPRTVEGGAPRTYSVAHRRAPAGSNVQASARHASSNGADDSGIGNGLIYLYADEAPGAIVGWTWSTSSSTPYQGTSSTSANYRPMRAGVLTGTGL